MATIKQLLTDHSSIQQISDFFNNATHSLRMKSLDSLSPRDLALLYIKSAGAFDLDQKHFVPDNIPDMTTVIHHGKNSLPAFTRFQKRFCRPPASMDSGLLWGYNHQTIMPITGAGYFVALPVKEGHQMTFDYTRLPSSSPVSWPSVKSNDKGLSYFIFGGLQDFMWKVSNHVSIGRAYKNGYPMPSYFILCRED